MPRLETRCADEGAALAIPLVVFVRARVLPVRRGLSRDPREIPSPLIGKPAPAFTLARPRLADRKFSPADCSGKVWLLNVWASWCVSCASSIRRCSRFAKTTQRAGRRPRLQGQARRRPRVARAERRRSVHGVDRRTWTAASRIDYGVYGVPETFVIDRDGVIRYKYIGPMDEQVINDRIVPVLKKLGAA